MLLIAIDLALALLATLRLTRLVTTDSIGQWWLYSPLYKRAYGRPSVTTKPRRWAKYVEGLQCPFCVGFWIGCLVLLSLWLVGGPGHAAEWWRWLAGAFALNYVVGQVSGRLD
jgi:hypothetical protein